MKLSQHPRLKRNELVSKLVELLFFSEPPSSRNEKRCFNCLKYCSVRRLCRPVKSRTVNAMSGCDTRQGSFSVFWNMNVCHRHQRLVLHMQATSSMVTSMLPCRDTRCLVLEHEGPLSSLNITALRTLIHGRHFVFRSSCTAGVESLRSPVGWNLMGKKN